MGVDTERLSSAHGSVGGTRRWRPGGRDHGGNASLFGALPKLGSIEHKDWEGMMLSACD